MDTLKELGKYMRQRKKLWLVPLLIGLLLLGALLALSSSSVVAPFIYTLF